MGAKSLDPLLDVHGEYPPDMIINPYAFAASGGAWTPASLTGLQFWLKADAIGGLNDGDAITTWADSSGNGNDATQSTGTAKPTYKTGILNGLPCARFDGGDSLRGGGTTSITGTTLTAFAIVSLNSGSANYARVLSLSASGQNDYNSAARAAPILRNSNTQALASFRNNVVRSSGAIVYGTHAYVVSIFDGTNHTIYVNGVAGSALASSGTFAISAYALGDNYLTDSSFLNGDIVECGVTNTNVSGADLTSLQSYLSTRSGI